MAKRFIDTGFYKSPFVRGLKGSLKSLYSFIICDCDGSGIWAKDLPIASAYIDFQISENEFNIFIEKGKAIDLKNGKYFFPDFIEHQYPGGLSDKNIAHKNFISELKKYNLLDENLKPLPSPLQGAKVMVKEIVTVKVEVEEKAKVNIPAINEFLDHCKTVLQNKYNEYEFSLISKYETWVSDGWKDGNGKKINNWKNKINNTIPFLKPIYQNGTNTAAPTKTDQTNARASELREFIKNGGVEKIKQRGTGNTGSDIDKP